MKRLTGLAPLWRAGFALWTLAALAYQYHRSSARAGFQAVNFFSYFTNLSNILASLVFLYLAVRRPSPRSAACDLVRGAAVVYMAITGVIFNILLRDVDELGIVVPWVNAVVHSVMPAVVVLDWLIDPPRWRIPWRLALWWLAFPVVYVTYSLIRGAVVHWYPYPFLSPEHPGGYGRVAAFCVAIAAVFVLVVSGVKAVGGRHRTIAGETGP